MKKESVRIGEYLITKLSETEYEYVSMKQKLDFHFAVENPNEISVFIFDSLISENNEKAFLGTFHTSSLEEAVSEISYLSQENIKKSVMWS